MMPSLLKTLLFLALGLGTWAQDPAPAIPGSADPPPKLEPGVPGTPKFSTHYFRVVAAVWTPDEGEQEGFPLIRDGTENDPLTRTRNAQPYFSANGVEFPPGASAVFHEAASVIRITNTAEQLKKAAASIQGVFAPKVHLLQLRAQIVEFRPELEDQLGGRASFAALQAKLGDGLKTICVSTVTTKSGIKAIGELDRATPPPKTVKGGKAAGNPEPAPDPEKAPEWPPPPGVERAIFECESVIGPAGPDHSVDLEFSLRYAAPAMGNRPALSTNFASSIVVKPGLIFRARTFTIADPNQDAPRCFAILLRCDLVDETGKTATEAREALFRKKQ